MDAKFKEQVLRLDNWQCQNLNCQSGLRVTVHHFHRVGQGGKDEPENAISLCQPCHEWCEGKGNPKINGNSVTGWQYTKHMLELLKDTDVWRWDDAYVYVCDKVEAQITKGVAK